MTDIFFKILIHPPRLRRNQKFPKSFELITERVDMTISRTWLCFLFLLYVIFLNFIFFSVAWPTTSSWAPAPSKLSASSRAMRTVCWSVTRAASSCCGIAKRWQPTRWAPHFQTFPLAFGHHSTSNWMHTIDARSDEVDGWNRISKCWLKSTRIWCRVSKFFNLNSIDPTTCQNIARLSITKNLDWMTSVETRQL